MRHLFEVPRPEANPTHVAAARLRRGYLVGLAVILVASLIAAIGATVQGDSPGRSVIVEALLPNLLIVIVVAVVLEWLFVILPAWRLFNKTVDAGEEQSLRFRSMLESVGVVAWEADAATTDFLYVSPQAESLLGYPVADWYEPGFWQRRIHPEDVGRAVAFCAASVEASEDHDFEYRMIHADGSIRWIRDIVTIVDGESDEPARLRGVLIDITETKRALAALMESEHRFRTVSDQVPALIWQADAKRRTTFVNRAWIDATGVPLERHLGTGWADLVHPDDLPSLLADYEGGAERQEAFDCSFRLRHGDAGYRNVVGRCTPRFNRSGELIGFVGTLSDITRTIRAEHAARQSNERLRVHVERMPLAYIEFDRDGRVVEWNAAAERIFGHRAAEVLGTDVIDRVVPADIRPELESILEELLVKGQPNTNRNENIRADGTRIICDWYNTPLFNEGELVGVASIADDVTERVTAEQRIRASEERYRLLTEHAADMISRHDSHGRYRYASPACRDILGIEPEELVGVLAYERIHPEDHPRIRETHQQLLHTEFAAPVRYRLRHADGRWIDIESRATAIRDGRGDVIEIVTVSRDVSIQMRAERAIERSRAQLRSISDGLPVVIGQLDEHLRIRFINAAGASWYARPAGEIIDASLRELVPADRLEMHLPYIRRALCGQRVRYEFSRVMHDGDERVFDATLIPGTNTEPTRDIFFLTVDVTEARRAAKQIEDAARVRGRLLSELNHRVKNSLGSLLTLIELCRLTQTEVGPFADAVRRRVQAMNDVHGLLSERAYQPIDVQTILETMIPPEAPGRVEFAGPRVSIPASQATSLGFVFQELMSNSLKYGALSSSAGILRVEWTTSTGTPGATDEGSAHQPDELRIRWRERGISLDPDEVRPAMGTQLIEGFARHELRGEATFHYHREGIDHSITVRPDYAPAPDADPEGLGSKLSPSLYGEA